MRGQAQRLIQELLQEEVTEFLGRAESARRSESDSATGYRNGYDRPAEADAEFGNDPVEAAASPRPLLSPIAPTPVLVRSPTGL